eukprot:361275-Chlamydomonas_euryale.AAC.3
MCGAMQCLTHLSGSAHRRCTPCFRRQADTASRMSAPERVCVAAPVRRSVQAVAAPFRACAYTVAAPACAARDAWVCGRRPGGLCTCCMAEWGWSGWAVVLASKYRRLGKRGADAWWRSLQCQPLPCPAPINCPALMCCISPPLPVRTTG